MATLLDTVGADLDTMLSGEWAEDVTIESGSITETAKGVFDLTYAEMQQNGVTVQSKNPRVSLYAPTWAALLGVEINDKNAQAFRFTIRGVEYVSNKTELDGTGWALCYLKRAKV